MDASVETQPETPHQLGSVLTPEDIALNLLAAMPASDALDYLAGMAERRGGWTANLEQAADIVGRTAGYAEGQGE